MGYYVTFDGGSGAGKGAVIEWCALKLEARGKSVLVLRDNELDDLRDFGAAMIPWCRENGIAHQGFLLPLFAMGHARSDTKILEVLPHYDFVLRDRSFVSSLAYQTATGRFAPEQIFDLHVNHLGLRVPDLVVIVDAAVEVAAERIVRRQKEDIGLGGKMSGGLPRRRRIRKIFLELPERFRDSMDVLVVSNDGLYTEDPAVLEGRIAEASRIVLRHMEERGMLS